MRDRKSIEVEEEKNLAPYAMKSAQSQGREYPEEEHPYRTCFQRDRDRVIHSNAFRRLEYKTQVFVYHEGDHYRTRLTHSIEGSQIARTIARALRLNEDLAEAIILAHDLGHTPFGHSGEEAMNRLMKEHGGFEHNRQSLRIVTLLEDRYPDFPGLNLSYEVREGIDKHQTSYDQLHLQLRTSEYRMDQALPGQPNAVSGLKSGNQMGGSGGERLSPSDWKVQPTLEAQIVNLADEIAYSNHDLDDGIRSGLITLLQLEDIQIWKENFKGHGAEDKIQIRQAVRSIINAYVSNLVTTVTQTLREAKIISLQDVWASRTKLVHYSSDFDHKNRELKGFLREKMYKHHHVERMADKARRILEGLFTAYVKNPKILPPEISEQMKKETPERVICDYIAGMTDRFALEEYKKLFDPTEKV